MMSRKTRFICFSRTPIVRLATLLSAFVGLLLLATALPLSAQGAPSTTVATTQYVSFVSVAVGATTGSTQSMSFTVPSTVTLGVLRSARIAEFHQQRSGHGQRGAECCCPEPR
jgi:hypothetical protein